VSEANAFERLVMRKRCSRYTVILLQHKPLPLLFFSAQFAARHLTKNLPEKPSKENAWNNPCGGLYFKRCNTRAF
jgi:hypothetical protein